MTASQRAVERVAREATGRLVALLARRAGDLALAEDAMSSALVAALERWPTSGVPDDPEGWLYTVARRQLIGQWRAAEVRARNASALSWFQAIEAPHASRRWPDERLPLLFVCAHPAIDPSVRAPLMLQAVLGMTAHDLGPIMGVASKTIGQRLWRAKVKIKEARIPFKVPAGPALRPRLGSVLDAIYGLYGVAWQAVGRGSLAEEALWLAEVTATVAPDAAEAHGLVALLRYTEARRAAHRPDEVFVPLDDQDPAAWDHAQIATADGALRRARACGELGSFQLEAAIQSALVHGRLRGHIDHDAIETLYEGLVRMAPTLGVRVGQAAARAEHRGAEAGLHVLDAIDGAQSFQPWWAVRAALLHRLHHPDASAALDRAIALTSDPAVRRFLSSLRE